MRKIRAVYVEPERLPRFIDANIVASILDALNSGVMATSVLEVSSMIMIHHILQKNRGMMFVKYRASIFYNGIWLWKVCLGRTIQIFWTSMSHGLVCHGQDSVAMIIILQDYSVQRFYKNCSFNLLLYT